VRRYLVISKQLNQHLSLFKLGNKFIRYLATLSIILTLVIAISCNNESSPSVTVGPGQFRYDEFRLQVQLPEGWVAAEGPERLSITGHTEGQVAFNSWGQEDFWARAVRLPGSDNSYSYGPEDVMSQIPEGGAYVALVIESGPPNFEQESSDYNLSDLSGLYQPHDWRQDSVTGAQFIPFIKWGQVLELEVACHPNASNETVDQLNKLLQSWRFDEFSIKD
jgi:hypothetical protein